MESPYKENCPKCGKKKIEHAEKCIYCGYTFEKEEILNPRYHPKIALMGSIILTIYGLVLLCLILLPVIQENGLHILFAILGAFLLIIGLSLDAYGVYRIKKDKARAKAKEEEKAKAEEMQK